MTKTMTIHSGTRHLATIKWCDGVCAIVSATDIMRKDIERNITYGLAEWVGEGIDDITPRHTSSDHPEFLNRYKEYLDRQFSFDILITEE